MDYTFSEPREVKLPKVSYLKLKGPAAEEHAKQCRDFIDSTAPYEHEYQIRKHERWRRSDLFKQAIQWLRKSFNSDAVVSMHFAPLSFQSEDDPDYIPTPVYDEFSAPINNEAARLGRPEYKPYVRPRGERPDVKARKGARLGEQVLQSMLRDMRWPEQEELGNIHMPQYGGWWLESYWDVSWEKTTRIPVQGAMRCPQCEFRLSKPTITEKEAQPHLESDAVKPVVNQGKDGSPLFEYEVTECLTCEPQIDRKVEVVEDAEGGMTPQAVETEIPVPPLEPFTPVDEELNEKDFFKRPLGEDIPLGEWKVETGSPYDYFLPNLGIDQSPSELKEWTRIRVRSLGYFRNRYENAHLIKAEKPEALMKYHPIAGERALYYSAGLYGTKLFANNARERVYVKKPWREEVFDDSGKCVGLKLNRGRLIIMGGDVLLFDGDFLIESKTHPGTFIPRIHLDYASNEARSGGREFDGMSMSERLFDACEDGNEIHSQIQDARVHEGSPRLRVTRGMNLEYEHSATAGSIEVWDPDPLAPDKEPKEVGNNLLNPAVYNELNDIVNYIARSASLTETERGTPPAGITAALALQFLQEQSGEQRRPRIRAIREMLMRVFSHGLQLCHELVREPREYWTRDEKGAWAEKVWRGMDLEGQTDVQIDPEPDHDSDLQRQQRILDFVKDIMNNIKDPKLMRKVAKKTHVDEDLFVEDNLQEETAERELIEWLEFDQEPVIDDDLDSHQAHYEQHGVDVMREQFRDLEDLAGWDKALPYLSNWQGMFLPQPNPVSVPDPMTGQPMPGQMLPGLDGKLSQPNPQTGAPGIPSLELRILKTWDLKLAQGGYQPEPGQEEALAKVKRFRAHMAAHKIIGERQQQAAAGGAQIMAAPEAPDQTIAGTVPVAQGQGALVEA